MDAALPLDKQAKWGEWRYLRKAGMKARAAAGISACGRGEGRGRREGRPGVFSAWKRKQPPILHSRRLLVQVEFKF